MDLEEYQTFKVEIEQARRDKDRAEGALRQTLDRIKEEYGCEDLEVARIKLEALWKKKQDLDVEAGTELERLQQQWVGRLEGRTEVDHAAA